MRRRSHKAVQSNLMMMLEIASPQKPRAWLTMTRYLIKNLVPIFGTRLKPRGTTQVNHSVIRSALTNISLSYNVEITVQTTKRDT